MIKTFTNSFFFILSIIIANEAQAQVGIGITSPDGSAILDLTANNKGMLAPRMTEAQKTGISMPATGLLIYQTDGTAGFWYFDGTQWDLLGSSGWSLSGNTNTVDGTNYLGTTDDVALNFKVNSMSAGRVGSSTEGNTMLGYQAGINNEFNGSTFIGFNAGATNSFGTGNSAVGWSALTANDAGFNNTAIGYASMQTTNGGLDNSALGTNTLFSNIGGSQNTAVGSSSLYSNTVGNGNSAVGQNSLFANTSGGYNSALGVSALIACDAGSRNVATGYNALNGVKGGNNNTGVGYTTGTVIVTGSNNTFVGSNADASTGSTSISNSTAIGYNAKVTNSNSLVLGSTTSAVKVGISVASPTNTLSMDGTAARTIWMERNSSAGILGYALTLQSGGANLGGTNLNGGDLNLSSGTSTGTGTSNIYFKVPTAGASGTTDNAPATKMTILAGGNVGINNTTPGATLDVNGSVSYSSVYSTSGTATLNATDYCVINTGSTATWTLPAGVKGKVIVIVNHGSGIITTSPLYKVSSAGTGTVATGSSVQIMYDGSNWQKIN